MPSEKSSDVTFRRENATKGGWEQTENGLRRRDSLPGEGLERQVRQPTADGQHGTDGPNRNRLIYLAGKDGNVGREN